MRRSVRWSAPVMVAALAFGGLAVAVAPSAAACGGYGEPACQTYVLTFSAGINAPGAVCSVTTISGLEGSTVNLPPASSCSRPGFSFRAWGSTNFSFFSPGQAVVLSGNRPFFAVWEASASPSATPTASPTATLTPTASPTATPTPTVSIPPGQTNPNRSTRPAPGVVVVSQVVADRTEVTEEQSRSTRALAKARAAEIDRGSVFQASVVPPLNADVLRVRLQTPDGETVSFPTLRAGAGGRVTTPAIRYTVAGTYMWVFERGGRQRFLAISVS